MPISLEKSLVLNRFQAKNEFRGQDKCQFFVTSWFENLQKRPKDAE